MHSATNATQGNHDVGLERLGAPAALGVTGSHRPTTTALLITRSAGHFAPENLDHRDQGFSILLLLICRLAGFFIPKTGITGMPVFRILVLWSQLPRGGRRRRMGLGAGLARADLGLSRF